MSETWAEILWDRHRRSLGAKLDEIKRSNDDLTRELRALDGPVVDDSVAELEARVERLTNERDQLCQEVNHQRDLLSERRAALRARCESILSLLACEEDFAVIEDASSFLGIPLMGLSPAQVTQILSSHGAEIDRSRKALLNQLRQASKRIESVQAEQTRVSELEHLIEERGDRLADISRDLIEGAHAVAPPVIEAVTQFQISALTRLRDDLLDKLNDAREEARLRWRQSSPLDEVMS
ncbi:hypothetical protein [Rhodospirillum sp. A1_3_36]|uniref:hypothetical protein n=1 Tax=Rhodospirillum sp. A1_3_36 TaxID=3391666 RepID=UPI0039A6ED9F